MWKPTLLLSLLIQIVVSVPTSDKQTLDHANINSPSLIDSEYDSKVSKGLWLVNFYSPDCPHCRTLGPKWISLTEELSVWSSSTKFQFAQVNCKLEKKLCSRNRISGYPTLNLYKDGKFIEECLDTNSIQDLGGCIDRYSKKFGLTRVPDKFRKADPPVQPQAVQTQQQQINKVIQQVEVKPANPKGEVVILDEDTFEKTVAEGGWFIKFYAPWCGHCKKLAPTWEELGKKMKGLVNIAQIDCDQFKGTCRDHDIKGYPTLKFLSEGKETSYSGSRALEALSEAALAKFGPKPITDLESVSKLIDDLKVALIVYNPTNQPIPEVVRQSIQSFEITIPIHQLNQPITTGSKFTVPHPDQVQLFIVKDGGITAYPTSFENSTKNQLVKWVATNQQPHIQVVDYKQLLTYFKPKANPNSDTPKTNELHTGILYHPEHKRQWTQFKNLALELNKKSATKYSYLILNKAGTANKVPEELSHILEDLESGSNGVFIVSFKDKLLYSLSSDNQPLKLQSDAMLKDLKDYHAKKLTGKSVINGGFIDMLQIFLTSYYLWVILVAVVGVFYFLFVTGGNGNKGPTKKAI